MNWASVLGSGRRPPQLADAGMKEDEMPTPEVGQIVRLADHDEKLVVKSLSADENKVELVTEAGDPWGHQLISVTELLPGEDLSAG